MKPDEDPTEPIWRERPKIELTEGMSGLTLNQQYFKHMKEISKKEETIKGESGKEVKSMHTESPMTGVGSTPPLPDTAYPGVGMLGAQMMGGMNMNMGMGGMGMGGMGVGVMGMPPLGMGMSPLGMPPLGMLQQGKLGTLSSLEMMPMNPMAQMAPMHPQTLSAFPSSTGSKPELQNIVSTVNMGCKLDLRTIALNARNAEYNPRRFAAVIMRIREPKTTALIFHSGKMVCTGAKSEDESKTAAKRYAHIIKKIGFPAKFGEFKIQNIVGSCDVGFPIRLEGLNNDHGNFCHYEPEIFPGLIYRMHEPKIVLLIFVSGKIVLTGARQREDLYTAYENIHPVLMQFKKKPNNNTLKSSNK